MESKKPKLGDAARRYIVDTPVDIEIAGVKLKTLILGKGNCGFGFSEGAKFPDFTGYRERLSTPQKGDWSPRLSFRIQVFDGEKWQEGELKLRDCDNDILLQLGLEEDWLLDLKYQYQL